MKRTKVWWLFSFLVALPIHSTSQATCPGSVWSIEGTQSGEDLGAFVASVGDVNRDGFDDVAVLDPMGFYEQDGLHRGQVLVFYGSATGLPLVASKALSSAAVQMGLPARAGDVNGDGFGDLLVGAADPSGVGGYALIYFGSAAGLPDVPSWVVAGPPGNVNFGKFVAAAGDVNQDGYGDVIVSDPDAGNGSVYIFFGGPNGPSTTADQVLTGPHAGGGFGYNAAGAGDTNGDGFADIIISEPFALTNPNAGNGLDYVYLGSPAGLRQVPVWTTDAKGGSLVGPLVGSAGDVNHDGFSDIVVANPCWSSQGGKSTPCTGKVAVYMGSKSGPGKSAGWTSTGQAGSQFGQQAVTAGDVNGDGYADLAISAGGADPSQAQIFVYLGSRMGLASKPAFVTSTTEPSGFFGSSLSTAGDTNGDGRSEIIQGDQGHDLPSDPFSNAGQACMYVVP